MVQGQQQALQTQQAGCSRDRKQALCLSVMLMLLLSSR
jgi:hypothetical protein